MNSMYFIVWLLPLIYMLHDFEEIFMAESWAKRYKSEIDTAWPNRQPFGLNYIHHYQTPTFAFTVYILFIISTAVSLLSVIFNNYLIWYGVFCGITAHFVLVHIPMCIKIKHYVPGIYSSVMLLTPSIWCLYEAAVLLHFNSLTILIALLLGIAFAAFAMLFFHKRMENWSEMLYRYSQK